mgnify:CR=1 FL=1
MRRINRIRFTGELSIPIRIKLLMVKQMIIFCSMINKFVNQLAAPKGNFKQRFQGTDLHQPWKDMTTTHVSCTIMISAVVNTHCISLNHIVEHGAL